MRVYGPDQSQNFYSVIASVLKLIGMGNCASANKGCDCRVEDTTKFRHLMHDREYSLLKLIYFDLGARDKSHSLTRENFLLFFHKNGYWGDRLFKEFDANQSNLITEKQFIKGIVKIFKTSEERKIELLFKFFSGGHSQDKGVPFSQFLTMLYNYPKEDFKNILNDEDFINKEIRSFLVANQGEFKGRRLESVCPNGIANQNIKNTKFTLNDNDSASERLESKAGADIIKEMNKKQDDKGSMTLKLKVGGNDVEIKTASIHHIVKKFARRIFKDYNIDIRTGSIKLKDFTDWMLKHKQLYNDYYNGFHNEIWEVDRKTSKPLFTAKQAQFSSRARAMLSNSSEKVVISLLHSTLIVTNENDFESPLLIICLEGLAARPIFEEQFGHGIEITHRDGLYSSRKFFLLNQELQLQWMDYLKYYKGSSISQLYQMGEKIGIGKFSVVYSCKQKATSQECAIKVIQSQKLDNEARKLIAHQSSIMTILSHPLLVFFKESIQTKTHIYIVTELVKGKDLFELVREYKFLGEEQSAYIITQVIVGVRYLHSLGIVHRDLKPENIMIEFDEEKKQLGRIKIIDFGFANYISTLREMKPQQIVAGTPNYIAPELLRQGGEDLDQNRQYVTEKLDNFSIGSILYFMLSGNLAFNGADVTEMLQKTIEGAYTINDKRWKCVSKNAKNLVENLLDNDIEERTSLDEALKHPWIREYQKPSGGCAMSPKFPSNKL